MGGEVSSPLIFVALLLCEEASMLVGVFPPLSKSGPDSDPESSLPESGSVSAVVVPVLTGLCVSILVRFFLELLGSVRSGFRLLLDDRCAEEVIFNAFGEEEFAALFGVLSKCHFGFTPIVAGVTSMRSCILA